MVITEIYFHIDNLGPPDELSHKFIKDAIPY